MHFFLSSSPRPKRKYSTYVKSTHTLTPLLRTKKKNIKSQKETTTRNASLSLSLSLSPSLLPRKKKKKKKNAKRPPMLEKKALLSLFFRAFARTPPRRLKGRIQRVCVCPFFYVHSYTQHDSTQATLECVLILGVLFCVWSFLRVHKKRKKEKKKKRIFFNGRIYHTILLLLTALNILRRRRRQRRRQRQKDEKTKR